MNRNQEMLFQAAAALKGLDTDALPLEELIRQALKRMAR